MQVNRNGVRGIVVGNGSLAEVSLPHLTSSADIRVGDLLVTSGLGGRFPPGYPVAEVTKVDFSSGDAFTQISARPLSHLDRSREVLLVWPTLVNPTPVAAPADVSGDAPNDASGETATAADPATSTTPAQATPPAAPAAAATPTATPIAPENTAAPAIPARARAPAGG